IGTREDGVGFAVVSGEVKDGKDAGRCNPADLRTTGLRPQGFGEPEVTIGTCRDTAKVGSAEVSDGDVELGDAPTWGNPADLVAPALREPAVAGGTGRDAAREDVAAIGAAEPPLDAGRRDHADLAEEGAANGREPEVAVRAGNDIARSPDPKRPK